MPPRRDLEQEDVTLVPDRRTYQPGEVAKLLVVPPFAPAEGVLTLRRSGLVREQRFTIAAGSETLAIPIEDGFTPNVQVQVDLVGTAPREGAAGLRQAPARPAFASGHLSLEVPPRARALALAVTPREPALAPGGETVLDLSLKDAAGAPAANGEAAVVVVDEAVLALTGYRLPDPLAVFYSWRTPDVPTTGCGPMLPPPRHAGPPAGRRREGAAAGVAFGAGTAAGTAPMRRMAAREGRGRTGAAPIRARTDLRRQRSRRACARCGGPNERP